MVVLLLEDLLDSVIYETMIPPLYPENPRRIAKKQTKQKFWSNLLMSMLKQKKKKITTKAWW